MRGPPVSLSNLLKVVLLLVTWNSASSAAPPAVVQSAVDEHCSHVLSPHTQPWDGALLASIKEALDSDKTWQFERYRFAPGVTASPSRQDTPSTRSSGSGFGHNDVGVPDKPRAPLIYCYIPKNACSLFKMLFLRLNFNDSEWDDWQRQHRGTPHYGAHLLHPLFQLQRRAGQVALTQLLDKLDADLASGGGDSSGEDPDAGHTGGGGGRGRVRVLPGLVVTRNPYVRLLSGYLDKVANVTKGAFMTEAWHQHLLKGHGFSQAPSFGAWVRRLHLVALQWNRAPRLNVHFKAQSHFCNMRAGVRFQYQIKLETLQATYPCLVHQLGLAPWVDAQWSGIHASHDCFYKPSPDLPCSWWRDALAEGSGGRAMMAAAGAGGTTSGTVGGTPTDLSSGSTAAHRTDATGLLFRFYDREIAALATELYSEDFRLFGYRTWRGPPHPITLD